MRLGNGEVLLAWPLEQHSLTAGMYYENGAAHNAIDLACRWGSDTAKQVCAAEAGRVVWVQQWDGHTKTGVQSYGNAVRIRHGDYRGRTLETLYAHLSRIDVQQDQQVAEGQQIGTTGSTGNSTGPHLHFEVRWAGKRYNPLCWLDDDFTITPGWKPYTYGSGEHPVKHPSRSLVKALDISKHQVTFDAAKAVSEGIGLVLVRACHGVTGKDPKFDQFVSECEAHNLRRGAYCFANWIHGIYNNNGDKAKARQIMLKELHAYIEYMKPHKINSWAAIDQENEPKYNRIMALSKQDNTDLLNEAAQLLRNAGYHPCLYCSASWVQEHVQVELLDMPVWAAWYYNDPHDPDFDGCKTLAQLGDTGYGRYLLGLGKKLVGWQFGRIGYAGKYGVSGKNIDRDWIYSQPQKEDDMAFNTLKGKRLLATSEKYACETFPQPDVNSAPVIKVPKGDSVRVIAISDKDYTIPGTEISAPWYKVQMQSGERYAFGLSDRWQLVDDLEKPDPLPENPCNVSVTLYNVTPDQLIAIAEIMRK